MARFDFSEMFCKNTPMANSIPESLRQILAEQYEEAQLTKILAQAFNYGVSVVFHPDGSRQIFPETTIDIGLSTSDGDLAAIETPPEDWDRLLQRPPKQTEIAVFPGNFRQGVQGKFEENAWKKDDLTNEDAQVCRGHGEPGHRGGMRHATSRPILMKLMNQSYKLRKYR